MPSVAELMAQMQGAGPPSAQAQPSSKVAQLMAQMRGDERPGLFSRFGQQALGRAEDIGNFIIPFADPLDFAAPENLPPAEGFGEKAADFLGSAAPDVAIGLATAPFAAGVAGGLGVARIASPILRGGAQAAVHSGILAPIEYGTRDPTSATVATVGGPLAALGIGALAKGAGRLLGRGATEVVEDTDLVALRKLAQDRRIAEGAGPEIAPRIREAGEFTPRTIEPPPPPVDRPPPAWLNYEGGTPYPSTPVREAGAFSPRMNVSRQVAKAAGDVDEVLFTLPDGSLLGARFPDDGTAYVGMVQVPEGTRNQGQFGKLLGALRQEMQDRGATKIDANIAGDPRLGRMMERFNTRNAALTQFPEEAVATQPTVELSTLVKDLVARGVSEAQASKLVSDPAFANRMADALEKTRPELAAILRHSIPEAPVGPLPVGFKDLLKSKKLAQAALEDRPVRTTDLLDIVDPDLAQAATRQMAKVRDAATKALTRSGIAESEIAKVADDLAEYSMNLSPKQNAELAEKIGALTPDSAERFINMIKGNKGVCPL